jgi:hypothetical protein
MLTEGHPWRTAAGSGSCEEGRRWPFITGRETVESASLRTKVMPSW